MGYLHIRIIRINSHVRIILFSADYFCFNRQFRAGFF